MSLGQNTLQPNEATASSNSAFRSAPLSVQNPVSEYPCGDFTVTYILDPETSAVGLRLLPNSKAGSVVKARKHLLTPEILSQPDHLQPFLATHGETSLVQIKLMEDNTCGGFSAGRTMRFNETVNALRLDRQEIYPLPKGGFRIETKLRGSRDFACMHVLSYNSGDDAVTVHAEFTNTGEDDLSLEMLSSFALGHLSPFDDEDSRERLKIHRFRSNWSAEGRHESVLIEDMHLERSWSCASVVNERFGQVGSMPVRGFFPFLAIEDTSEGVFWGAQLACASSWQMEVYRKDDQVSISGGLADREFGHWVKRVAPGETFITSYAWLSTAASDLDCFCQRLTRMQSHALDSLPPIEESLPILFNEYCSTWNKPNPAHIQKTVECLKGLPIQVFVIDDGWTDRPENAFQHNGDWEIATYAFPEGLKPVSQFLKDNGMVAGLWFEFEICTEGTEAFKINDHKLMRDGRILQIGTRHFWDFNDPWTFEYLTKKVINRLKDDGFGYIKIDYNDNIGLGCDHPDSLGEGLRHHMQGVQRFFAKLREEIPDLIIENCASGGHRLEPSMMGLASMASFSDAHETPDIPIIAANLHRLILPRQSQIWAVLRKQDSDKRLLYSLAACFLGRACLSGDMTSMGSEQMDEIREVLHFYEETSYIIKDGQSYIYRDVNKSYRSPEGWQVVLRESRQEPGRWLVVAHTFAKSAGAKFSVPLPNSSWRFIKSKGIGIKAQLQELNLHFVCSEEFSAYVGYYQCDV